MAFVPVWGSGFEMGAVPAPAGYYTGFGVGTSKYTGVYGLVLGATASHSFRMDGVVGGASEMYCSFYFSRGNATEGTPVAWRWLLDSGHYVEIRFTSSYWDAYVDGVKVADHSLSGFTGWHHVEFRAVIDNASGILQTKINGVPDIDYTGDTQPDATNLITRAYLQYWHQVHPLYARTTYYDDMVMGTGGWPGDFRFVGLVPNGDSSVQWTGSDGNQVDNYALVDERPPGTADYVLATASDLKDRYTIGNFDAADKVISCVVNWARHLRTGSYVHQVKLVLDDGTEDVSDAYDSDVSAGYAGKMYAARPSGGAWTDAAIDGLIAGVMSVIATE